MVQTTVTVVIPAYNVARYITECLRSLQSQTLPTWRCVVVDDGSQDNTADQVAALNEQRIVLLRQDNRGVSAARNRGLAACDTPFVMFLDGDDVLHPSALERLSNALSAADGQPALRSGTVAAFGSLLKILPSGRAYPGQKPLSQQCYPTGDVLAPMLRHNFLANGGQVLMRTDVARTLGGFDARLRLSEDWEFWCRLAAQGEFLFVGAVPEVFSLRVHPGSSSGALSAEWSNHQPTLDAIAGNTAIRTRLGSGRMRRLLRSARASAMWEAGRVNYTFRRYRAARRLMLGALSLEVTPKRSVLTVLAVAQRWLGRPLHSRLRFRDADLQEDAGA